MQTAGQQLGTTLETEQGLLTLTAFLGRGKSAYSYLATNNGCKYVVKMMHDEPCPYYDFGNQNKVTVELNAYHTLDRLGIPVPKLLSHDEQRGFLVKSYIEGVLANDLIADGNVETVLPQLYQISKIAQHAGLNLDYFPANFVCADNQLFYVDYEHNPYDSAWDLHNWGIYYWANSAGMADYQRTGDILNLNQTLDSGIPIKAPLQSRVNNWQQRYQHG
ncbi:hypothetical protein DU002_05875 [Corallincola holothuriorum]|uniref:Uncharacterized protein n=1 Tax=Corallincola holothuriorum TaxID=2282215 RepID=A0A368NLT0_9GAMM|nr:hypothetical protein [Corallincola holothuriorum]RCU50853.1 hypothetical protein DU002_05875 [Corallincola holothuriorum]